MGEVEEFRVVALYDFDGNPSENELRFRENDVLVVNYVDDEWYGGYVEADPSAGYGYFPVSYVSVIENTAEQAPVESVAPSTWDSGAGRQSQSLDSEENRQEYDRYYGETGTGEDAATLYTIDSDFKWSSTETPPFQSFSIDGTEVRSKGFKKFTVYKCRCERTGGGGVVQVDRRYSDFFWLDTYLSKTFMRLILPQLPPKTMTKSLEEDTVKDREYKLSFYMEKILAHPVLSTLDVIARFCGDQSLDALKKEYGKKTDAPFFRNIGIDATSHALQQKAEDINATKLDIQNRLKQLEETDNDRKRLGAMLAKSMELAEGFLELNRAAEKESAIAKSSSAGENLYTSMSKILETRMQNDECMRKIIENYTDTKERTRNAYKLWKKDLKYKEMLIKSKKTKVPKELINKNFLKSTAILYAEINRVEESIRSDIERGLAAQSKIFAQGLAEILKNYE